ncbi:MAG: DUF2235 domain-containing protein [Desulfobulbaceae bacterium]|nr:DUF2235 domain-containing protein [Desulfobulbaceae bacterium]
MTQSGEGSFEPGKDKEEENKKKKKVKVRISLFFDGTLNNRANVRAGVDSQAYKDAKSEKGWTNPFDIKNSLWGVGSYENALSNVAKMEEHVKANASEYIDSIYIEGQGTSDLEADSFSGKALGLSETGVTQRAKKGVDETLDSIKELLIKLEAENTVIEKLSIDVFGFSRGAAAARNFLHIVMSSRSRGRIPERNLKSKVESLLGFEVESVEVEFAGLYDTVSSVGPPMVHKWNSRQLSLDAISHAKEVVHLVAADEHRENFSLTNTKSAGSKEIYLPGVHSDIGGGYRDKFDENGLVIFKGNQKQVEAEFKRLVENGWVDQEQLSQVAPPGYRGKVETINWKLELRERIVRNEYDRIPLHIMAEFAREAGINVSVDLEEDYEIEDSLLVEMFPKFKSYAKKRNSKLDDWLGNKEPWEGLRKKFFHMSAHYSATGMAPRFVNGKRKRLVYEG